MAQVKLEDKAVLGLSNDPQIWIAEGASRFSVKWKNKHMKWSVLLARLRDVTRTQETQAEYMAMGRSDQDKIKDVGGFVGGTLAGGRRTSGTVKDRYLVTFDLDQAPTDLVERLLLEAPYAWAVYTTHKHKADKPRFRLIAPLSRSVDPDEYEAITRKLAEEIGLEYFDSTTFQPSRLMYWPSCSRDGEYIFEYNDGPSLDADEILARYPDWHDMSYWPVCPDEIRIRKKRQERQQDPLQKKGLVGTFCRTYSVPEAIAEFLSDVYTPTDKPDRYTYAQGSTFGGLVVYDDGRFCYSNHATDPAGGQDLNAFDLVRVHRFGHEDADAREDTPTPKLPSYKAMLDFVATEKGCVRTYDEERRAQAADDFKDEPGAEREWRLDLERGKKGIDASINNLKLIFAHDPALAGIRYNELSDMVEIAPGSPVPWREDAGDWLNSDDSQLYVYLSQIYTDFRRQDVTDVLTDVSRKRSYHPIREYLQELPEWDGTPRMETLFVDYLGAEDCPYTHEVTKRWLLAAVCRIMEPGCKFDYMPVLSGPGGIGKSTLIGRIGGRWCSDALSFEDMRDKTAAEKVQGTWINEISELKGMRKTDIETIKSFVSRQIDKFRPSYGRVVESHPRTCVCIGTSNAEDYLKDTTGNRRFWPVPVTGQGKHRPWDLTEADTRQIWAEVMFYYDDMGERDLTLPEGLLQEAEEHQIAAMESDDRAGLVELYLARLLPDNWEGMDLMERRYWLDDDRAEGTVPRRSVCVMEIWAECLRMNPAEKRRSDSDDITRMLIQLGWTQKGPRKTRLYGNQKMFFRTDLDAS